MKYLLIAVVFMGYLLAACDGPTEPPIPKTHDEAVSADEGRMLKLDKQQQNKPESMAQ